ncbi:replicative DNA helicase [Brackiella oedipodis]|uniref:replicative DNA helicase n=1 Tax=Brackiella oedipodis TaxID=124225 RepID=UPI000B190BAA|nr:replicative DNA helicase [Brackiella oedipodis]
MMPSDNDPAIAPQELTADSRSNQALQDIRLPPHSIQAEQAVLGGLLLDNLAFELVSDILLEDDFYRQDHRLIWRHIQNLIKIERPADVLTVSDAARLSGDYEDCGGLDYLNSLAHNTPSAANIKSYADIVREAAIRRKILTVVDHIASQALSPKGKEARQLLDEAEADLFRISQEGSRGTQDFISINAALTQVLDNLHELEGREGDVTGTPSGFTDLDTQTSGLHSGDLLIVAGRPSMGKTSFAMNIVEHVALVEKLPVAVFSMEMGAAQLAHRMLGSVGKIDQQRMRSGHLNAEDWSHITHAMQQFQEARIFIDETPGLNPIDLRARARRLSRKYSQLGLIVIDYLQLMSGSGAGRAENRATEISEISRSLKGLARELNCPVIALSQLNRSLETRTNKRPIMSDLRESGAIEQDADVILFIYRDEVYNPESPDKGLAEIIIGKQRNGPIGTVRLTFLGQYTKFVNNSSGGGFIGE